MKRRQIQRHRLTWLLLLPVLAVTIISALMVKPAEDAGVSDRMPSFLGEER